MPKTDFGIPSHAIALTFFFFFIPLPLTFHFFFFSFYFFPLSRKWECQVDLLPCMIWPNKENPKIKQDQKKTISLVLAFLRKCVSLDSSVYMSIPSLTFAKIKPRQNATAALFTFSSSTLIQPIKTYDLDDATKQRVCFTSSDSNEIKHVSDYNDSTSLKNC